MNYVSKMRSQDKPVLIPMIIKHLDVKLPQVSTTIEHELEILGVTTEPLPLPWLYLMQKAQIF